MGFKPRKKATSPKLRETIEARVDFLNVDLELEGPKNLAPLVRALGDVYVLHTSSEAPFVANLELGSEPEPGGSAVYWPLSKAWTSRRESCGTLARSAALMLDCSRGLLRRTRNTPCHRLFCRGWALSVPNSW